MKSSGMVLTVAFLLCLPVLSHAQIVIDGDDSDWASIPILIFDPDNIEGEYPEDQQVSWTDIVDIKEVSVQIIGLDLYALVRFWGAPVWPNHAYPDLPEDANSRGHVHIIVDLDNDIDTGAFTTYFEGHIIDLGAEMKPIGAEQLFEFSFDLRDEDPISYGGADISGVNLETGEGMDTITPIYGGLGEVTSDFAMTGMLSVPEYGWYVQHGWGPDFLEVHVSLAPAMAYWQSKGFDYWAPGSTVAFASYCETPYDDWGLDMTDGGEYLIPVTAAEGTTWGTLKALLR